MQVSDNLIDDIDNFRKDLHSLLRKDDIHSMNYVLEMKMVKYPGKIESAGTFRKFIANKNINIFYLFIYLVPKVVLNNFDKRANTTMFKKDKEKSMATNKLLVHHVVKNNKTSK